MKFSVATVVSAITASSAIVSSFAFAPNSNVNIHRSILTHSNANTIRHPKSRLAADVPSDCETEPLSSSSTTTESDIDTTELAAGAPPILAARSDLLSLSSKLTSRSPTGLFITLPKDRSKFMKAVARLEAIAPTTSDESEPLSVGDWELVATSRKTTLDLVNGAIDANGNGGGGTKKNGIPKLNPTIKNSINVTQRIRSLKDPTCQTIDRIDNVISINSSELFSPSFLPTFLNPLEISNSKVILVHNAKVQSFVPYRTKLSLSSVVLNVAGKKMNLDPDGADVFGLNIPSLNEWMYAGEFDTVYVDEEVRVCRGTIGVLEETRVFVKSGVSLDDLCDFDVDVDVEEKMDAEDAPKSKRVERVEKLNTAVSSVQKSLTGLTKDVQETLSKDLDTLSSQITTTAQDIRDVVTDDLKEVEESLNLVKSAVIGDEEVENAVDEAVSAVQGLTKDVVEGVEGLREKVEDDVEKIQGAVVGVRGAVLKEDKAKDKDEDETVEAESEDEVAVDVEVEVEEEESEDTEDVVDDAEAAMTEADAEPEPEPDADDGKKKKKGKKKKNKKKKN